MEPFAVNRFTMTKKLYYEGMLCSIKERVGPFTKKALKVLAILWVLLAAVTLLTKNSPLYAIIELVIMVLLGLWLCVYMPRNQAKRAWKTIEDKGDEYLERVTRFFPRYMEISRGSETTTILYEHIHQILMTGHLMIVKCEDTLSILIPRDGFITGDMDSVQSIIEEQIKA